MEPALSRGDAVLKIDSTPQAIVVSVGIVTTAGLAGFLVWSGWDAAAIIAAAGAIAGLFGGQLAVARRASVVDAKQDAQLETLDQVARQTNGELKATVASAVELGIARGLTAARAAQGDRRG